ncbi:MAG TPA: HTH domain-containing protein [Pirellulaceae bacterium]|nr:HTH domain-containing protein [Pirellulaceae bacterium]
MATKKVGAKTTASKRTTKPRIKVVDDSAIDQPVATPAPVAHAKPGLETNSETNAKRLSALDAAARVLRESGEPLNSKQMIEAMSAKGYWTSPGGKTPHATLFSAILREINTKGHEARFVKSERGKFTAAM